MDDSKSNHEKYLEQIALFDPLSNPSDFENIGLGDNVKNLSPNSDLKFLSDNSPEQSNKLSNESPYLSPVASKETKLLSGDSEKLKAISNNNNTFYNFDTHYHESPTRVPLSTLTLPDRNQLSSSHSFLSENHSLSPIDSKKFKQKNSKDQSPHHSFNSYRFNNSTNISCSSGSIKNDNFGSNRIMTSKGKKFDGKRYINRAEYKSSGGPSTDCPPSLRRRSFQTMKPKYNSVTREFDSGRFHITLSSHSEVSQSENSSCEENEKEKEKKKENQQKVNKDKNSANDTKKNRKVKRFNISYSKNTNSESNTNLQSDDQDNIHLKHACSDRTVIPNHNDVNNENNIENNLKNKIIDINSDDDDDLFYKMQQSSMPVLHRHKKKGGNSGNNNKSSKNSNSINNNPNQIPNNNEINNIDFNTNKNHINIDNDITSNSNHNSSIKSQNQIQNPSFNNNNILSPPKSTPFTPPILNIDISSTLTANSLSGKLSDQDNIESKGKPNESDDLISIF